MVFSYIILHGAPSTKKSRKGQGDGHHQERQQDLYREDAIDDLDREPATVVLDHRDNQDHGQNKRKDGFQGRRGEDLLDHWKCPGTGKVNNGGHGHDARDDHSKVYQERNRR